MSAKSKQLPKLNAREKKVLAQPRVIRIAALVNPTTKRKALIRVNAKGALVGSRDAERMKVKQVKSWRELPADTWARATKLFRAGKGKVVGAGAK